MGSSLPKASCCLFWFALGPQFHWPLGTRSTTMKWPPTTRPTAAWRRWTKSPWILWLQSLACQSWPRHVSWMRCCPLLMQSICIILGSKAVNSVNHEHQTHVPTKLKDHSYFNEIGSPDCYISRFAPVSLPLDKVFPWHQTPWIVKQLFWNSIFWAGLWSNLERPGPSPSL